MEDKDDKELVIEASKEFTVEDNSVVFMPKSTFESYNSVDIGKGSILVAYPNRLPGKDLPDALRSVCDILKISDKKTRFSKFRFWQK